MFFYFRRAFLIWIVVYWQKYLGIVFIWKISLLTIVIAMLSISNHFGQGRQFIFTPINNSSSMFKFVENADKNLKSSTSIKNILQGIS